MNDAREGKQGRTGGQDRRKSRKPYKPPRLVDYGSLTELTRSGFFMGNETGSTFAT